MLDALRKASQNWFGRAIMGVVMLVLIVSFGIWGIGDIFRGIRSDTVVKVGDTQITSEQFRNTYQTQLQRLQQQQRRAITSQQAHAMGLDSQVLGQMIANAVLDEKASKLGLAISDKEIVKAAMKDPAFKGPSGQFDPQVFQSLLRDNGLTEAQFVHDQRGVYLRRDIADALAGSMTVPQISLEAINQFRNETRSIDYFTLDASAAGEIAKPTEDQLKKFYQDRKNVFRAPEYRTVSLLSFSPASLADPKSVSDTDALKRYEQDKSRLGTPEERDLQQVVFPSEAAAKAAHDKIVAGQSLDQVAKDAKLSVVDLGTVKRGDIFDKAIANAGFSLPAGGVSAPVKGDFGWVLLRAAKVVPASVKPFSAVEDEMKKQIATERASTTAQNLRDKIEDQRASGHALAEAAKTVGRTVHTVDVDAQGLDKNGKPVDIPEKARVLKAIFASDIGVDNDVISLRDGGFLWFEISNIEPARQKTFEEVKGEVEKLWHDDQVGKRLAAKADDLVKEINGGADIDKVAAGLGAKITHANDVKRIGTTDVPPGLVNAVFNVKVNEAGSAVGSGLSREVFKVLGSVTPPIDPDSEVSKAIKAQLREQSTEDVLTEYLAQLQSTFGVQVNQTLLRQAMGNTN